jgi:hypothetical protein
LIILPRGIRNNNPGNIDLGPTKWQGLIAGSDPRFCTFRNAAFGYRALALNLMHIIVTEGKDTITGFVYPWAPPSENNTGAYVAGVAEWTQIDATAKLPQIDTPGLLALLTQAITVHENGTGTFAASPALVLGVNNALGRSPLAAVEGYSNGPYDA